MKTYLFCITLHLTGCFLFLWPRSIFAQDSTVTVSKKIITLKEVVVRNNLNVPDFIERIQKDTSFYKAFKNLRILGYTSLNDIRMMDKKGVIKSTLQSKTKQLIQKGCRSMEVIEQKTSGKMYDGKGNWNYYTAELYASLFFTTGIVCGETNIVKGDLSKANGKTGIDKHKEQLKRLFFNPGTKIPIPFIGNKIAIFAEDVAALYDFVIDMGNYQGQNCYLFKITAKDNLSESEKGKVVISNMTTWFNSHSMEIVARDYYLSFNAGVYDFDVHMEVQIDKFKDYLVPKLIRYTGNWHVIFKKREKGIFTATLFDFNVEPGSRFKD